MTLSSVKLMTSKNSSKMPLQSRLKKGLLGFGGRLGILDRQKGEKIRVESSGSGFPARKSIELQEDILGGGVLAPSEQLPSGADSLPEDQQCLVAVIRQQELVIDVSETSQGPPPDPDHEVEYAVLKAASEGRWEEINQVFNRPGQQERVLHAQNEFGWSPLHFAVYYGHLNIVNQLVNVCRLPPEQKTKKGRTPLMVASGAGHLPVADLLLETHRSNVNEEDSDSATAVLYAARRGHLPVVKVLLAHGADVFHKAVDSTTALHHAAYGGSIECVEYLLPLFGDRRFAVDELDGWTCVHFAVGGGSVPVVRYLVDQCGFDLGLRTEDGSTPLMLAAGCGRLAVAKLLLETYRCDVNEEDSNSKTPVMYAVEFGNLPVMKMLIEHGANVLHKRPDGLDCFLLACKEGHQEIVRELLTRDEVDRNVVDKDGCGALHQACQGGHTELVQMLVKEFRFPPDTRDNDGRTPLDLAEDHVLADIFEALHLNDDSSAPQPHESALEDVCWITSGIESLFVTPFGGDFPLVPVGGQEDVKQLIHLHVPPGAVRADGEGVVEVCYAVILDGPFQIPEGYKLCSTAVYINYSQGQTTKPFLLSLPHWSGGPDHPVFVTSPHTLPEGEQYYPFHLLEGGEFGEGYGIVEVDGHCSLFALACRLEDTSRYYASLWEREEGNILHSKVAVTFESNEWMRILKNHWTGWKKRFTESFEMKEDHIESCLTEDRGRGWRASRVGKNWVGPGDIEYVKKYKSDENELQYAVEDHLYPPAICHDVRQSELPRHLQSYKCIDLHIHGAKEGDITFQIDVLEEKEAPSVVATHPCLDSGSMEGPVSLTQQVPTTGAPSVVATHLCLKPGSTARPVSLTQQVSTTGGEMEITQSRSEVAMSDRDPLSQPVHYCKRYAVLFRKHVSREGAGKGKAVLEYVGLTPGKINLCYQSNPLNEEEAIQDGLKKWQETQGDHCTWQDLLEAMTFAGISEQHCSQLVQELHQWMQGST